MENELKSKITGDILRNILAELQEDNNKEFEEVFKKLGIQIVSSIGNLRPLSDILNDIEEIWNKKGK